MKFRQLSLLLALGTLATSASAQILLKTTTFSVFAGPNNSIESTGVAASGYVKFFQNNIGSQYGKVEIRIDNLSVYNPNLGTENGVLTGFAFNVGTGFSYVTSSFTEQMVSPYDPTGMDFTKESNIDVPAGGNSAAETFEIGASTRSPFPITKGLAGGHSAIFTFRFKANDAAKWNSSVDDAFFGDADKRDIYFRFQAVSDDGCGTSDSDKVFWGFDPGGPLTPVPEPSTYGLIGAGLLLGVALLRRRKQSRSS